MNLLRTRTSIIKGLLIAWAMQMPMGLAAPADAGLAPRAGVVPSAARDTLPGLEGLSPGIAATLQRAREETRQLVATLDNPAERSEAWGRLGMFYHAQHLAWAAEDAYSRAVTDRDLPRWRYLRAIALSERGELDSALVDFAAVTRAEPSNPTAWYRMGAALLVKGDVEAAGVALKNAQALVPDAATVLVALGDVAFAQEDWQGALGFLERANAIAPDAGQIAYKLAMVHRRLGDIVAARTWLQRRAGNNAAPAFDDPLLLEVAQMSNSARFFVRAGEWALARAEVAQALAAFANAVALDQANAAAGLGYAYTLSMTGQQENAEAEIRRVLAVHPNSAEGWYLLAWLLRSAAPGPILDEARAAAARSIALEDSIRTRTLAAGLAMRSGRFDEAVAVYARLIGGGASGREGSKPVTTLTANDVATVPANAPQTASEQRPALAGPPRGTQNLPYFHYWHGMALLAAGNCGGRDALAKAVAIQPNWGEAHVALTRADVVCGNARAAAARARALYKVQQNDDIRISLAMAEMASGNSKAAARLAGEALPHPDAVMVLEALKRGVTLERPFARESAWWVPPEVR